jgi:cell division cycle protein 37
VDKKSMVRWKQAQIHKKRREKEDARDLLKKEYETTARFLEEVPKRISQLEGKNPAEVVLFLDAFAKEVDKDYTDPMRKESLGRMEKWPGNWETPDWGEVLKSHVPWNEEIMSIGKSMEEFIKNKEDGNLATFIKTQFDRSLKKFADRQPIIHAEIVRIETEMNQKITSDHLVTGFDKTVVLF